MNGPVQSVAARTRAMRWARTTAIFGAFAFGCCAIAAGAGDGPQPAAPPAPQPVAEPAAPRQYEVGRWTAPETPARPLVDFSHQVHTAARLKTECIDCHRLSVDGNRFRPASDSFCTPCHVGDGLIDAFRKSLDERPREPRVDALEPIHRLHVYYDCDRCHESMRLSAKVGDLPLPPTDNSDEVCVTCHARAVTFSHAQHVAVDGKVGADCSLCHDSRPDGLLYSIPGHPQCWQCHDISLLGLTEGCNLCHLKDPRAPKTYHLERASTLHKEHPRTKVACNDCHAAILTATTLEELRAARAAASDATCERCHTVPR